MRISHTKTLKLLIFLTVIVVLRLLYLMTADQSVNDNLLFKPAVETANKEDERVILNRILKDGVKARLIHEENEYYILSVLKDRNKITKSHHDSHDLHRQIKLNRFENRNVFTANQPKHRPTEYLNEGTDVMPSENVTEQDPVHELPSNCPKNSLLHKNINFAGYGKCVPHKPSYDDCLTAYEMYGPRPELHRCYNKTSAICKFQVVQEKGQRTLKVHCNKETCKETEDGIVAKGLNRQTGEHEALRAFSLIHDLEMDLPDIIKDHDYVFLECGDFEGNHVDQVLAVPPLYTLTENKAKIRPKDTVNVNIILIDSVARAHFYRSLPNTIQLFKNWTKDPTHSPAEVLDFELFQSVEGHTTENLHAMFTGKLFPADRPRDEAYPSVGMETLFGHFQKSNYQTMWQEDLCWKGVWGLMTDLGIEAEWENIGPKLEEVHIHRTGMTHSSCEMFKKYDMVEPFNGPRGNKICYNGIFQHSYFLQYVLDTLKAIRTSRHALPLFSYLALNVGHDQDGLRVQTLDAALAKYSNEFAMQDNTLTILLADHGNTYTEYTVSALEGRFEMFHPSLFFIIPNNVAKLLGDKTMKSLRINQGRLITMVDLHPTLMTLADPLNGDLQRTGLFAPISSERTCDHVDLRTPNLCVCDGWDSPTLNDTTRISLVEYAIGQLNNQLQKSLIKNLQVPLVSSCGRLQPIRFENVRERNSIKDGGLVTSFDIVVPAGNAVSRDEDIFRVEVKSMKSSTESLNYKLVHYERLSMFGKYKTCADKSVNLKLCVCNLVDTRARFPKTPKAIKAMLIKNTANYFRCKVLSKRIGNDKCMYLIKRIHHDGVAFAYEVANVCLDKSRDVLIASRDSANARFSVEFPLLVTVPAGSITFAFAATRHIEDYEATFDIKSVVVNVARDS